MIDEAFVDVDVDLWDVAPEVFHTDPALLDVARFAGGLMARFRDGECRHYDRAAHLEELAALAETWEAARGLTQD